MARYGRQKIWCWRGRSKLALDELLLYPYPLDFAGFQTPVGCTFPVELKYDMGAQLGTGSRMSNSIPDPRDRCCFSQILRDSEWGFQSSHLATRWEFGFTGSYFCVILGNGFQGDN